MIQWTGEVVVLRWSGVTWSASTKASLISVEQRGLDGVCMRFYRCRAEELSGVVVALTVGRSRSMH
jgi:hypothetical protein